MQVNIFTTELPTVLLHQVEPVVGTLGVVDDRVRVSVRIKHQEGQRTADHMRPEGVAEELHNLDTVHIAAEFIDNLIVAGGIPSRDGHDGGIQQSHSHRIERNNTLALGDVAVTDMEGGIVIHIGDRNTIAEDFIFNVGNHVRIAVGTERDLMEVVGTDTIGVEIVGVNRQGRQLKTVKREVEGGVMQQSVTDGVRIFVPVGVELHDLDAHAVVTSLIVVAAEVNMERVVVEHIQQIGAQMRLRNTSLALTGNGLTAIGHGEIAVIVHIGHSLVIAVGILLGQFIIDVGGNRIIGILVASGIHAHTDVEIDIRSQIDHTRDQLALRKDGILDVEDGGVMGNPGNRHGIVPVLSANERVRSHLRIEPLFEGIDDPIETGLLELDVHPRGSIQRAQTDHGIFIVANLGEREHAGIIVQGVPLRNSTAIEERLHQHEAEFVKGVGGGVPIGAVGGIGQLIFQIDPLVTVVPTVLLHQVEPVIGILGVVDDGVRASVRIEHQERQVAAIHIQRHGVTGQMAAEGTVDIVVFVGLNGISAGDLPFRIDAQSGVTTAQQDGAVGGISGLAVSKDLVAYLQIAIVPQLGRRNLHTVLLDDKGDLTGGVGKIVGLEFNGSEELGTDRDVDRHFRHEMHNRADFMFDHKIDGVGHQRVIHALVLVHHPEEDAVVALLIHFGIYHII